MNKQNKVTQDCLAAVFPCCLPFQKCFWPAKCHLVHVCFWSNSPVKASQSVAFVPCYHRWLQQVHCNKSWNERLTTSPYIHRLAIWVLPQDFRWEITRGAGKPCQTGKRTGFHWLMPFMHWNCFTAWILCVVLWMAQMIIEGPAGQIMTV